MLTWAQRFRYRVWARSSMWLIPLAFMALSIGLSILMPWVDRHVAGEPPFTYSASSAQATLSAIASGMLVFTGFVFSILTFAIQFGASTFTPRLIRTVATDTTTKIGLGTFIATFIYALLLLAEVAPGEGQYVPQFSVLLSVVLVGVSLLLFLALIAKVTGSIRPGTVVADVARHGRRVIADAFPHPARTPAGSAIQDYVPKAASRSVNHPEHRGGVLQAVHTDGVVALADRLAVTAVLVPAVGDYVPSGAPVFRIYGGEATADVHQFLDWVAFGDERTFRQDPSYAIRILVDIAIPRPVAGGQRPNYRRRHAGPGRGLAPHAWHAAAPRRGLREYGWRSAVHLPAANVGRFPLALPDRDPHLRRRFPSACRQAAQHPFRVA